MLYVSLSIYNPFKDFIKKYSVQLLSFFAAHVSDAITLSQYLK